MQKNIRSFENGRTMLETIAVIVIIVLLTIGAFWAYKNAAYQNEANLLYEEIISEVGARLSKGTKRVRDKGVVESGWKRETAYNNKKYTVEEDCPRDYFAVRVDEVNEDVCKNLVEKNWGDIPVKFFRSRTKGDLCENSNEIDTSIGFYIRNPEDCGKSKNGQKIRNGVFALVIPLKNRTGSSIDTCYKDEDCCGGCQRCDKNSQTCIDNCDATHICNKNGETCECVDLPECPAGKWRKNKVLLTCPADADCPGGANCDFTCHEQNAQGERLHRVGDECVPVCSGKVKRECKMSQLESDEEFDAEGCKIKTRFLCEDEDPNTPYCVERGGKRECVGCRNDDDCEYLNQPDEIEYRCDGFSCEQCPNEWPLGEKCYIKEDEIDDRGCVKYTKKTCPAETPVCNKDTNTCEPCPTPTEKICSGEKKDVWGCPAAILESCPDGMECDLETQTCRCPAGVTCCPDPLPGKNESCIASCGCRNHYRCVNKKCRSCPSTLPGSREPCVPSCGCEDGLTCGSKKYCERCSDPLPGEGESCTENCGCASPYMCSPTTHTCKDCRHLPGKGQACDTECGCAAPYTCDSTNHICKYQCKYDEGAPYGESCSSECSCKSGVGLECSNNVCQCSEGTFWNNQTQRCTSCLVNYGLGNGGCPTSVEPKCNMISWTCESCPEGYNWSTAKNDCVENCPSSLPKKGEECREECGCVADHICVATEEDSTKFVCKCDGDCKECEDDLDCEGNVISWKTTCDLETHKCVCPPDMIENASGRCVYCWKDGDISRGCAKDSPYSECNELANEGFGKCVCPPLPEHGEPCNETCGCKDTENEECNPVSLTCECAGDSFWDSTLKRCIDCLGEGRNYCSNLEGSCPTVENPVCNSNYECEPCPDNQSWICGSQICSPTYKVDQVVFESCKKNKKKKCLSPTCGGNGVSKKGLKLYPGKYSIIAIGAGGGVGYDKNGTGSHNRSGAASGGGGGCFQGVIQVNETVTVDITVGTGGVSVHGDTSATGGTGGTTKIGNIISCPGGKGGYADAHHNTSYVTGGAGGAKCTIDSSYLVKTTLNKKGETGDTARTSSTHSTQWLYATTSCKKIGNYNWGGVCSGVSSFDKHKRSLPWSGNDGYVKIIYKGL